MQINIMHKIKSRLGDFWWWSLCLFLTARLGDLINAFIGLWLVPRYVGADELGAIMPLTQITSMVGMPLAILVMAFTKFLNEYKTKGEDGKVKSLIKAFWLWTIFAILIIAGLSALILPGFFERIRVVSGSLGILVIASAVLGAATPVFTNALQALKKFKALTVMGLLTSPVRLVVMLIAMPYRALSGYMLGQTTPALVQIAWSCFSLRKELSRNVKAEPFWDKDKKRILKFVGLVAVWYSGGAIYATLQAMIIRQRLLEIESAAYYMISRFAEIVTYAGVSLVFVMFPMVMESHTKGRDALHMFFKMTFATLMFGGICIAVLSICGVWLFSLVPSWRMFLPYMPEMTLLGISLLLSQLVGNFNSFEMASNRFYFLWYGVPITLLQSVFLVSFTGYKFFYGILPDDFVNWMGSLNIATLKNILCTSIFAMGLNVFAIFIDLIIRYRKRVPNGQC